MWDNQCAWMRGLMPDLAQLKYHLPHVSLLLHLVPDRTISWASSAARSSAVSFFCSLWLRQWLWRQVSCRCGAKLGIEDGGRYRLGIIIRFHSWMVIWSVLYCPPQDLIRSAQNCSDLIRFWLVLTGSDQILTSSVQTLSSSEQILSRTSQNLNRSHQNQ